MYIDWLFLVGPDHCSGCIVWEGSRHTLTTHHAWTRECGCTLGGGWVEGAKRNHFGFLGFCQKCGGLAASNVVMQLLSSVGLV